MVSLDIFNVALTTRWYWPHSQTTWLYVVKRETDGLRKQPNLRGLIVSMKMKPNSGLYI